MAKKLYLGEGNNSNKVSKLYIGKEVETYNLTVEVVSSNFDGWTTIYINDKQVFEDYFDNPIPIFRVKKDDIVSVVTGPNAGEAYIGSYSGLTDVSIISDNEIEGKVIGDVYISIADTPMSRNVSDGVSSSTKALTGYASKVKKAYIGVDEKSKLFYTSGYIWKKYKTIYFWDKYKKETNWKESQSIAANEFDILARDVNGDRTRYVYRSISPDNNGNIVFSGRTQITQYDYRNLVGYYARYTTGNDECGYLRKRRFYENYDPDSTASNILIASYNLNDVVYKEDGYNWLKIGSVQSENQNSYPGLNGTIEEFSDGYGYKFTHKGQGSYITDVESDNPNAFPDNGYKDGYWYVKQNI